MTPGTAHPFGEAVVSEVARAHRPGATASRRWQGACGRAQGTPGE